MGVDVEIRVQCVEGYQPPSDFSDALSGEWSEYDSLERYDDERPWTHEFSSLQRYYDKDYQRGPWPVISAALLTLLRDPNILAVGYGGDSSETVPVIDMERLQEISRHYYENHRGNEDCIVLGKVSRSIYLEGDGVPPVVDPVPWGAAAILQLDRLREYQDAVTNSLRVQKEELEPS